ncbi:hypothetical protein CPC08DRAFT_725514 [Agrocybe pediades]|nr:hypothetical protein CPC08DRAFT_725514 [Agrocybe pediades]
MYGTKPSWLPIPSTPPPSPAATPQENPFDNLQKAAETPLSASKEAPNLETAPPSNALELGENEQPKNIVSDWVEAVSARLSRLPAIEPDAEDPANYTGNQRLEALWFKILPWDLVMADNAQGKPQLYYPAFDEGPDPGNLKHEFFLQLMVKLSKKPPPTLHLGYQVFGFKTTLMAPEEWPEYGVLIHQIPGMCSTSRHAMTWCIVKHTYRGGN